MSVESGSGLPPASEGSKPTLAEYAADLARRMGERMLGDGCVLAVGILGFAAEDERLDEHDRAMAKGWLDRLVDSEGNPLDDKGRDAWQWAAEENMLSKNGTLSFVLPEGDRVTASITVRRRCSEVLSRADARDKLSTLFESYLDHLLDEIYAATTDAERPSPAPVPETLESDGGKGTP